MNSNNGSDCRGSESGDRDNSPRSAPLAALILTVVSGAAVALSVALLFGYSARVTDAQATLENSAQAALTHAGAIEYAIHGMETGAIAPGEAIPRVSTGGMVTDFRVTDLRPVESRTLEIQAPSSTDHRTVRTWIGPLVAGRMDGGLTIMLVCASSGLCETGFPAGIELSGAPDHWTVSGNMSEGGVLAAIACGYSGSDTLYSIAADGTVEVFPIDEIDITDSSVLTVGEYEGSSAAVITDGSNRGVLIDLERGVPDSRLVSEPGTCPVLAEGYGLFGDFPGADAGETGSAPVVSDMFTGDFDRDETMDLAWVGPSSMAAVLSGGNELWIDSLAGGKLVAWGFMEGRYGLGGLWEQDDGRLAWRKLLWSGYQTLPAAAAPLAGCSGRLLSDGKAFFCRSGDGVQVTGSVVSSHPLMTFPEGEPVDFDGSGRFDIAVSGEGVLRIHIDPAGSGGMEFELDIATGTPGETPVIAERSLIRVLSPGSPTEPRRVILLSGVEA